MEEIIKKEEVVKDKPKKLNLKKSLPWIILFLIIMGLGVWYVMSRRVTEVQEQDYSLKTKEAQAYLNSKEYSSVVNSYYEATEIVPQRLEAFVGIVDILLMKNRANDAIPIVRESTKALSSDDRSYLYELLGNYFMKIEDYERAKSMYEEGLGLGVKNVNAELALGRAYLKLGRINDAKKQVSLSGYNEDNSSEANLLLAYIWGVSDIKKAKEQVSKVSPTSKWATSYDEYDRVLKTLDEDEKYNATKLSRVYINAGYPYLALEILKPIADDIVSYLDGMYYMGRAYLDAKEYGEAIEAFDKAITIGGMEEEVFWGRARAFYGLNNLESALDNYSRALGYAGKDISEELLTEYINILLENNQDLKAVEEIRNVLVYSEKPFVYLLGVKSNYHNGEKAKIDFYLQQLDKLELTDIQEKEVLYWKARVALDSDDLEVANIYLDELLDMDKFFPRYHLLLGILQSKKGDTEEAKQAFEKSIEYDLKNELTEEATKLLSNLK